MYPNTYFISSVNLEQDIFELGKPKVTFTMWVSCKRWNLAILYIFWKDLLFLENIFYPRQNCIVFVYVDYNDPLLVDLDGNLSFYLKKLKTCFLEFW